MSFPSFVFAEPVKKEIYVIDSKARVIIYTSDFFPLFTLSKRNGIETPLGLTVDAEGNVYVAQAPQRIIPDTGFLFLMHVSNGNVTSI